MEQGILPMHTLDFVQDEASQKTKFTQLPPALNQVIVWRRNRNGPNTEIGPET